VGLLRLIATAALVWFVFRWLDRAFGGGTRGSNRRPGASPPPPRRGTQSNHSSTSQPKDDSLGDYVDFEEIEEK
jgi:hypothetical protein